MLGLTLYRVRADHKECSVKLGGISFISRLGVLQWSDSNNPMKLRSIFARTRLFDIKHQRGGTLTPVEQHIRMSVVYLKELLEIFDAQEYVHDIWVALHEGEQAQSIRNRIGSFQLPIPVTFVPASIPLSQMCALADPCVYNMIVSAVAHAAGITHPFAFLTSIM